MKRNKNKTKSNNSINEQRQQQESVPRRHETVANINGRASSFHTVPRRVSWSDRYSVSFFDGGKSPSRCCATDSVVQPLPSKDGEKALVTPVFPPLPFASPHHGDKIRATMNTADTSISSNTVVKLNDDGVTYHDVASYIFFRETISSFSSDDDSISVLPTKTLGYSLGEAPKCNDHMIIPTTREEGIEYASSLQPLDFAFVLCNDGQWTFSIVCDITQGKDRSEQPRMRFALDRHGSTKSIPRKNWGHKIRLLTDVNNRPLLQSSTTLPSPTATNAHSIHRSTHCRKCWYSSKQCQIRL